MVEATLQPGQRISEYVLERRLGRGGFGEVWKARHHIWRDKVVAVKVPLDRDYVHSLRSEGILQHEIESEHIVKTLGLDPDGNPPYFVMEYVDGQSLRDFLKARGKMRPEEAIDVSLQVLEVLRLAHEKGIVHRDLKPENILIHKDGRVLLTDFGLGKVVENTTSQLVLSGSMKTRDGRDIVGTINYMSPEQRDPDSPVDGRSDIYSFGILLFEMLTGERPQGGEVPGDLVRGLDKRFDRIFKRCYARLEKRYGSPDEIIEDMEAIRRGEEEEEKAATVAVPEKAAAVAVPQRTRVTVYPAEKEAPPRRVGRISAGLWVRSLAQFIDFALLVAIVPSPAALPLWIVYDALCTAIFGRTIGKWILGLQVVRTDFRKARLGPAICRTLGKIFLEIPFLFFLLIPFTPNKRGIHDFLADTRVIWAKKGRLLVH
jgi:serine/threonine protein kinase